MFGHLQPDEIEQVLKQQYIGRIGCHADGITYVVTISYAYDGAYIYGHTAEGMKVNMMRKNPKVCFQVDDMVNMGNWNSVVVWGEYEELGISKEREHALRQLLDRSLPAVTSKTVQLGEQWPFPPNDVQSIEGIVFRIRVTEKTGRYERNCESYSACSIG
jgi:Predicted flavin-nucleotide-binding protein